MTAEVITTQLNPYGVDLEEGKTYKWCRCGRSKTQPFCDKSHEGTGIEPVTFVAARTETVFLCGCKETGSPPYCDGTHTVMSFDVGDHRAVWGSAASLNKGEGA